MTILPKKKVGKEKGESESVDKNLPHHPRHHSHPVASDSRHDKSTRVRSALPAPGREDPAHIDPGTYDTHGHEGPSALGHNKRRHRSSPHRNHPRKHRGGHVSSHVSIASVPTHSPQQGVSYEEEETRRNSDDEYVPPQHPENIEEVFLQK